jgi:hypothetical protein
LKQEQLPQACTVQSTMRARTIISFNIMALQKPGFFCTQPKPGSVKKTDMVASAVRDKNRQIAKCLNNPHKNISLRMLSPCKKIRQPVALGGLVCVTLRRTTDYYAFIG